ncbi:hypothetical protein UJ101_02014 [Flavobacteriaceae bacterium UJ101]|nr:hypothetical protein UJ101_02014 [Flavobacteriaceae bacterium UJ101]
MLVKINNMKQKIFGLILMMFTGVNLYSQSIVKGIVKNELGETLTDVEIITDDGQDFTFTDENGAYSLVLEEGVYTLKFDGIDGGKASKEVVLKNGEEYDLNVTLSKEVNETSDGNLNEVQIVGRKIRKGSESEALVLQKKAVMLKEVVSAQELSRKGVSDAAGAVSKIAGVSKQEGTGDVYVRGLGDRYMNTTLNGLPMPSNDIEKKNIDLDLFATDVIENVAVSKTFSSEFSADFGAGNVDITSKNYTGNAFISPSLGVGINTRAVGKDFVKSEGTGFFGYYGRYDHNPFAVVISHGVDPEGGGIPVNSSIALSGGNSYNLGEEGKLSFFLTGSFGNSYKYREGQQQNFTTVQTVNFPDAKEYEYSTTSTLMGNLVYKLNDKNTLKYNSIFINSSKDEVGYYGYKGQGFFRDLDRETGYYQQNVQFNQDMIIVNQLLGEHELGEKWNVNWGLAYNHVNSDEPDRKRISIENYDYELDDDPTTNASFWTNNSFDNQRFFQKIKDDELAGNLNLSYELSDAIKLKLGYTGRHKERDFENIRYGYKNFDPSLQTVDDITNLNAVFNYQNINAGLIETDVFRPFYPELTGLTTTNAPGLPENTYTGQLDVHAGVISSEINLGEKWLIVPGVRIENASQEIEYDVINLGNNGIGKNEFDEMLFLPNLNIKYALTKDQNVRFAASKTASFAEFKEVAPYVYEGVTQRVGGNPDLLGHREGIEYTNVEDVAYSDIYNIDLKYEWFLGKGELLSLASFYKQIHDPVNLVTANDATGTERFFRTGEQATIFGVELEVKKKIAHLGSGKLSGGLNAAYMHTEQDLYENISGTYSVNFNRTEEELQGASPFILNADLNYETTWGILKPTFTVVMNYFSDRIYSLGSGQLGNKMEKAVPTLDFVMRSKIGEKAEVSLRALNILDPSIEIYREGENADITLSEYKNGIEIGLGFNYKF